MDSSVTEFPQKPPVLLTIAGFDPSSGAGVTADLQVFAAHGMFGTSAITALTVQSTRGVTAMQPVDRKILRDTLEELQADLPAAGIKIGMLGSAAAVGTVAEFLSGLSPRPPTVLDPVLCSSSGRSLLETEGIEAVKTELLPLVDWITPNWMELGVLCGCTAETTAQAETALDLMAGMYPALGLIATAGDRAEHVDLLRTRSGRFERIPGQHVETTSTHGTGCAFSSALLCGLMAGLPVQEAVKRAKRYVEKALALALGMGGGSGPMNLLWPLRHAS